MAFPYTSTWIKTNHQTNELSLPTTNLAPKKHAPPQKETKFSNPYLIFRYFKVTLRLAIRFREDGHICFLPPPPRFPSLFKKPLFFWERRVFINPSDFCPFEAESFKVFSTWQPWRPRWRPRPFYPLGVGFGNIFIFNRGWSWDFSSEIWLFLFLLGLVFVRKNGWQLKNWHTFPHVFFWGVWGWG